jgi:hypothetical protein
MDVAVGRRRQGRTWSLVFFVVLPKRCVFVINEVIFVNLCLKNHVLRTWVHFHHIRQSNWTEGGGLQIFATFLSAIEAI